MPTTSITLADLRSPSLTIVCEPCGRRGFQPDVVLLGGAADHAERRPLMKPV
jgi:hypothetical protein